MQHHDPTSHASLSKHWLCSVPGCEWISIRADTLEDHQKAHANKAAAKGEPAGISISPSFSQLLLARRNYTVRAAMPSNISQVISSNSSAVPQKMTSLLAVSKGGSAVQIHPDPLLSRFLTCFTSWFKETKAQFRAFLRLL